MAVSAIPGRIPKLCGLIALIGCIREIKRRENKIERRAIPFRRVRSLTDNRKTKYSVAPWMLLITV